MSKWTRRLVASPPRRTTPSVKKLNIGTFCQAELDSRTPHSRVQATWATGILPAASRTDEGHLLFLIPLRLRWLLRQQIVGQAFLLSSIEIFCQGYYTGLAAHRIREDAPIVGTFHFGEWLYRRFQWSHNCGSVAGPVAQHGIKSNTEASV